MEAILAAVDLSAVVGFVVAAVMVGVTVQLALTAGRMVKRALDAVGSESYESQSLESYMRDGDNHGL